MIIKEKVFGDLISCGDSSLCSEWQISSNFILNRHSEENIKNSNTECYKIQRISMT